MAEQDESGFPRGIGAPATRALHGAGYTHLRQLAGVPAADLKKLHGMGPKALRILQEHCKRRACRLDSPPDPFAAARLGPLRLRNRVLKAATFEGMSPANLVSGRLIELHRRMAGGGTAMTTVSYIAASRDGMGAPSEKYIHDAAADGLARIAAAVHAEGARISAQLGHAGAVGTIRRRYLGPSAARTIAGTEVHLGHRDRRMASGSATAGACIHCNKCVPSMCTGTRCVLDQPDPGAGIVAVT